MRRLSLRKQARRSEQKAWMFSVYAEFFEPLLDFTFSGTMPCMACKKIMAPRDLYLEHIRPVAAFPELENDPRNFGLVCAKCNRVKGGASNARDYRRDDLKTFLSHAADRDWEKIGLKWYRRKLDRNEATT